MMTKLHRKGESVRISAAIFPAPAEMEIVVAPVLVEGIELRRNRAVAPLAALGLHALLFLAAIALVRPHLPAPPPVTAISVDLVPALPAEARPTPPVLAAPTPTEAPDAAAADASSAKPSADGAPAARETPAGTLYTATQFYSARLLAEPAMARIRRDLAGFATSERVIQLCNIEALEQIRRARPGTSPDTLVGYAFADIEQRGLSLAAPGGAYRVHRHWYQIDYTCTATADLAGISAFQFRLGDEIPESQWDAHSLNAEDAEE